jgi:beta-glucosidase
MARIDSLLGNMTLAEKLGQLTMTASSYAVVTGPIIAGDSTQAIRDGTIGSLLNMIGAGPVHELQRLAVEESRLRIPLLLGLDVIHGHRTIFPIPLAEAGTLDPQIWEATAREAARETAADGLMLTFAPMLDVSRDPRAKVHGFQGADLSSPESVAACAKHFCAYGPVTAGREYASVDISERQLHEVHLPAFAEAVKAGVATIMPAFTDLNGVPMTAHRALLRDYLRGQLGWDGVLISDYNAIGELLKHRVAADLPEAAALALNATVDIDMMSDAYRRGLPVALERGLVKMEQIDAAVLRVLRLKEKLGLFEHPYGRGGKAESKEVLAHRRRVARDVGARSIVMLKNERNTLPLPEGIRRLSVIGPLADTMKEMHGPWAAAGYDEPHVSVMQGLRAGLPGADIRYASGVTIQGPDRSDIEAAVNSCESSDAVLLVLGEAANMSGEAASRARPELPGQQRLLAEAVLERARALRIPVVTVLFSGRPLVVPWLAEKTDALLAAWFLGSEAGNALCDVLTGRVSPSARTVISWPRALGQVPIFFAERPSGRPFNPDDYFTSKYLDVANDPLFAFGHGLTYGRCVLSNLRVSPERVTERDTIKAEIDILNEGNRACEETVFLFTRDKVASVTRPLLELKGYTKVSLQAGERRTATITIPATELRFPGIDLQSVFEAGEVEVYAGPSADRAKLLTSKLQLIV